MTTLVVSRERPPAREDVLTATGVFVAGGWTPEYEQALVTAAGGAWLEAAREAGAVYGGFSAGASVAAKEALVGGWKDVVDGRDYAVCPEEAGEDLGTLELRRGLGVVDAVIDVHAAQWGTLARLVHAIRLADGDVGYAIDEQTTLELEDGAVAVHGAGLVHRVRDLGDGGVRVDVLAPGVVSGAPAPLEGVRVLDLSRLLPGRLLLPAAGRLRRGRRQGRGHRDGRLRPLGAARVRRAPTTPPRGRCSWRSTAASAPSGSTSRPRAAARRSCAWPATPTCCSSPSGPACSTASASAGTCCARSTPGSSTARSRATARPARCAPAPGTT